MGSMNTTTKLFRAFLMLIICLILLSMTSRACSAEMALPPDLLKAIHMVETGGRLGPVLGDHGKALGPFQIHRSYWEDSRVPGRYENCADYDYSVKVVTAWMSRYVPYYVRTRNYEAIARSHNGGMKGYFNPKTQRYWAKVKKHLTK